MYGDSSKFEILFFISILMEYFSLLNFEEFLNEEKATQTQNTIIIDSFIYLDFNSGHHG